MVFMVNETDFVWQYFPINHINPLEIAHKRRVASERETESSGELDSRRLPFPFD